MTSRATTTAGDKTGAREESTLDITLQLVNDHNDELGRLPLLTVRVAAPGGETERPDLAAQMAALEERVGLALAQEGMAAALDPLGVRLALSRGLLSAPSEDGSGRNALIPIPVRPLPAPAASSGSTAAPQAPEADAAWDDLFHLERGDSDGPAGDWVPGGAEDGPDGSNGPDDRGDGHRHDHGARDPDGEDEP